MKRIWIIAIGMGLAAGVTHYLHTKKMEDAMTGGEPISVLAVKRALEPGETLDVSSLAVRHIPVAWVDDRAIRSTRLDDIAGLPVSVPMAIGQTLLWTDLERRDALQDSDLAHHVIAGQRAMTIPVNAALSMGGLLRPGHRVDIIGTFQGGRNGVSERMSVTLLQNITVLATGRELQREAEAEQRFSTVTLSVTVEEGEVLSLSSAMGTLSLVLRGHQDLTIIDSIPPVRIEDVLSMETRSVASRSSGTGSIERLEAPASVRIRRP